MTIIDNPSSIIKGLCDTYVLQGIKRVFYKDTLNLGDLVVEYDVSKYVGRNGEEIYPYLSSEGYIGGYYGVRKKL